MAIVELEDLKGTGSDAAKSGEPLAGSLPLPPQGSPGFAQLSPEEQPILAALLGLVEGEVGGAQELAGSALVGRA